MKKLGAVLALALTAVVACDPTGLPFGDPTSALGFAVRPGAVQPAPPSSGYEGPMTLVPSGDCVLGVRSSLGGGANSDPGIWEGADGCTRLDFVPPAPGRTPGQTGMLTPATAPAAVPGADGAVIGLARGFYRRDRSGAVTGLFQPESDRHPVALARAGRNLVGVGTLEVPGGGSEPVAWLSDDEGRTAREIPLPHNAPGHWLPKVIAADGDQVLVAGALGAGARVWASGDAGETWTLSEIAVRASDVYVTTVLRAGGKWLMAGVSAAGPLVVTGEPGHWQLEDPATLGAGRISGGTVDKAGRPVLIGERDEQDWTGSSRGCAVVWVREATGWQRGELGCPRPLTAAVTLLDGRVLLASNHDLWIRP